MRVIFIRIEPSSAVPIYRQIIDQIKYLIAVGTLKKNDQLPGVRQLAEQLAVNQNTILKVYNQLCQEKILQVDRGNGTFVSAEGGSLPMEQRKETLRRHLREIAVLAVHLNIDRERVHKMLDNEFNAIEEENVRRTHHE